ncbi:hypothetical protein, partial [Roseibium sp.]|uniref:hypothetical protein n=1 Tax=Roseibium sp. TaxID=1936156 RepID=UPI0025F1A0AB
MLLMTEEESLDVGGKNFVSKMQLIYNEINNGERLQLGGDNNHNQTDFSESYACWGWYDSQSDVAGNLYRWCGGEIEAGLSIPYNYAVHRAVVLSIRPFRPDLFKNQMVNILVNGEASSFTSLSTGDEKLREVLVAPKTLEGKDELTISFMFKNLKNEAFSLGQKDDKRNLAFNLAKITWLSDG